MKSIVKEGKTKEEVLESIISENNLEENTYVYSVKEQKGKLFKNASIIVEVYTYEEIINYIKEILNEILVKMGIETTFESQIRDNTMKIKMYSNNNPILIGKNGQTLKALESILKQIIFNITGTYPYISLDVENYKDKQIYYLEKLAKNVAREVRNTKVEAKLDSMTSYERRIVHNVLTDFKGVYTESVGEAPNRYIVIKPEINEEN